MSQNFKNILLTGGMGYIGSHTAVVLSQAGYKVILYDNLCNSDSSVLNSLSEITGVHFPFVKGDVRDTAKLKKTLERYSIDAVIHFAGLKAVGESVSKPIEYYSNNVAGIVSTLDAMRSANVRTIVFSSSATVYGDPKYLPIDEEHPTHATNPYGRSKLQSEDILSDVAKSTSVSLENPWRIACLRYFNPVGAHESGLIGEDPSGIPNNLMPYITRVASGELPKLYVFGNDYNTKDGTGVRDYIHVMDIAEGHRDALDFLSNQTGWHAINLGTGVGYSVLDMVNAFELASKRSVPYQFSPRRKGDVSICYAKSDKARQQLGWKAIRSLEDMCKSAWKFQV